MIVCRLATPATQSLSVRGVGSHALGAVARSKGMTEIACRTGLGRRSLYKALSPEGRPEFKTVLRVVRALGPKLTVTTA